MTNPPERDEIARLQAELEGGTALQGNDSVVSESGGLAVGRDIHGNVTVNYAGAGPLDAERFWQKDHGSRPAPDLVQTKRRYLDYLLDSFHFLDLKGIATSAREQALARQHPNVDIRRVGRDLAAGRLRALWHGLERRAGEGNVPEVPSRLRGRQCLIGWKRNFTAEPREPHLVQPLLLIRDRSPELRRRLVRRLNRAGWAGRTTEKQVRPSSNSKRGSGEPLACMARKIFGTPVLRVSASFSSLSSSPARRLRAGT